MQVKTTKYQMAEDVLSNILTISLKSSVHIKKKVTYTINSEMFYFFILSTNFLPI